MVHTLSIRNDVSAPDQRYHTKTLSVPSGDSVPVRFGSKESLLRVPRLTALITAVGDFGVYSLRAALSPAGFEEEHASVIIATTAAATTSLAAWNLNIVFREYIDALRSFDD